MLPPVPSRRTDIAGKARTFAVDRDTAGDIAVRAALRDKPVVESYVAFDATIFEWLRLQGKAAPWLDIYRGSCVDRAIRTVWPEVDVVETGG
jgi:hypothetical protein